MELFPYDKDEYQPLKLGNKFSPISPFRMIVSGSSDSGKTTMIMNLLIGNKMVDKENGSRYILCHDVILIGKFLDEPKWIIVRDFYNDLAKTEDVSFKALSPSEIPDLDEFNPERSTVIIFEDLMHESKKIQEQIAKYFTQGRHRNVSPIYVAQRFFAILKTIRDNVTYISLHRGGGSLSDIKNIISRYTENSDHLASIIDDLTMKQEFIVFDLRRSKNDPLSIRCKWDKPLESENSVNIVRSILQSKFNIAGQEAISIAKKENRLVEFAKNMPSPNIRKNLLAEGITTKNADIWARYVFREASGITTEKDLGPEWQKFAMQIKDFTNSSEILTKNSQFLRYKNLMDSRPLDEKKYIEGCKILLWLLSNGHIDQKIYQIGIKELGE